MSVIQPVAAIAPTSTGALYVSPQDYPVSVDIRVVNFGPNPVLYYLSLGGIGLRVAYTLQPGQHLDIEKGLKLPPNTSLAHECPTANVINAMVTGVQDDGS